MASGTSITTEDPGVIEVGIFSRRPAASSRQRDNGPKPMGPGRRLTSSLGLEESTSALNAAAQAFKAPPYEHMPALVPAGYSWLDGSTAPDHVVVVCLGEEDGSPVMAAFWGDGAQTEIGLFALGGTLQLPIVGYWKQQDTSLSSIGEFPGGLIRYEVPTLPRDYFANILILGDYPISEFNQRVTAAEVSKMFKIKGYQYISSENQALGSRFVEEHKGASPQQILNDLEAWNHGVVPYIQELPGRIQGLLLDCVGDANTFWQQLERY